MLVYSIEAAIKSSLFDRVYVSTEDEEIASISMGCGAAVHPRPVKLAGDLVSATDVCIDVYNNRLEDGDIYDVIVCLQPSSPLRTVEDICDAWDRFRESGADYLVSVTPIDPHYFHWAVHQQGEWWEMVFNDRYMKDRQFLPPIYRPNGSIKIGRVPALLQNKTFFGSRLIVYETPEERSVHVASQFDFDVAECLMHKREITCIPGEKV